MKHRVSPDERFAERTFEPDGSLPPNITPAPARRRALGSWLRI
jgi:hypothetical protein